MAPLLLGRDAEISLLDELIEGVKERGGALVVRGDAGIGKSTLVAAASARARDHGMAVLAAAGVQSEASLAFAGLHQLLQPILGGAEDLPGPQREALLAAFGITDAAAPDLFLTALATLDLLSDTAARAPVLLVIEDAHWLDRPTGDVLSFVGRRLELEPIVLLFAIRDGFASPFVEAGLPELHLGALDGPTAGKLLDTRAPQLAAGTRGRILGEAQGNPLALVELPASLGADAGEVALPPAVLPLTRRLESAFAARTSELPEALRTTLLVAASDDGDDLAEVLRAASLVAGDQAVASSLDRAISAGLIDLEGTRVRFRHPLIRSAIYQSASSADRRAAHAALAGVIGGQPDRSAWHRAASVVEPNESVASELEAAAVSARRRGGVAVAVAALERAAQLSEDIEGRSRRLLLCAQLAFELGRPEVVDRLLSEAEALDVGERERARLTWLREMHEEDPSGGAVRVRSLVEISDRTLVDGDRPLAMHFLRAAALRCYWADPGEEARDLVVTAAERATETEDDPELISILAWAAPIERGDAVLARIARLEPFADRDPAASRLVGTAATSLGAFDLAPPYLAASVAGLRSEGRLGLLAQALVSQAFAAIYAGNWDVALPAAEEASRLARETAQARWLAGSLAAEATLAALRGDDAKARGLAMEAERTIVPLGNNYILALIQFARGTAALGAGQHEDAFDQLRRMFDPSDIAYHAYIRCWAVAELADAAARIERQDEAQRCVEELESLGAASWSPILDVGLRSARPLLAPDDEAEALFQEGLSADLTSWPFFRARLLLAYGEWLRRRRRVAESRTPLRTAREGFDALGAVPWGERARQELRASGESSDRPTPGAWTVLSPQELRIAQMAAEGLSNREIGQRLYLSHRTIGSHLHRLFPKLGVTSRGQLSAALAGRDATST